MDSKEILETFGISKNFGILLFIQSIIVIIGCFLAFQDAYNNIMGGYLSAIPIDIINLLLFLVLIYYSFIGFRKNESHFKIAVYLFIISLLVIICSDLSVITLNSGIPIHIFGNIISLILVCYFAYNLNNYDKAKISILLVVLVQFFIVWILMTIVLGLPLEIGILKIIYLIPAVSIALTYIARYNKEGFKQLDK